MDKIEREWIYNKVNKSRVDLKQKILLLDKEKRG